MSMKLRNVFFALFLCCATVSIATSYLAFRARNNSQTFPKSTTPITPFDAFAPGVSTDVQTGISIEGVYVGYMAILANTLIMFVPLASGILLKQKLRSRPM